MSDKLSEVPKWVSMFIAVFSLVGTMAVGYGTLQTRIDNLSEREAVSSATTGVLDKKIELIEKQQIIDKMNIEYMKSGLVELTINVKETNQLNRDLLLRLTKSEKKQ